MIILGDPGLQLQSNSKHILSSNIFKFATFRGGQGYQTFWYVQLLLQSLCQWLSHQQLEHSVWELSDLMSPDQCVSVPF